MKESEKQNLYETFNAVINSIIAEKKQNEKYDDLLNELDAKINLGLQITEDYYFWVNLVGKNGDVKLNRGKLDEYDLELKAAPEDLMYYSNGENSLLHMMFKKNTYGNRKLRFSKGTTGMNFGLLLKLPKILVLD
ncbi:MAG: hypothetical protein GF317_08195 [Candidatus Lokiarchaeota archaeon]|nr:hypothetical protein [Candidatus Lokiarchaeota archaeon]MBD3199691.1 hypothetical protein [Candidatus Lokiarchaeota archaeon]